MKRPLRQILEADWRTSRVPGCGGVGICCRQPPPVARPHDGAPLARACARRGRHQLMTTEESDQVLAFRRRKLNGGGPRCLSVRLSVERQPLWGRCCSLSFRRSRLPRRSVRSVESVVAAWAISTATNFRTPRTRREAVRARAGARAPAMISWPAALPERSDRKLL